MRIPQHCYITLWHVCILMKKTIVGYCKLNRQVISDRVLLDLAD